MRLIAPSHICCSQRFVATGAVSSGGEKVTAVQHGGAITTARKSFGTKREIGEGVKEEKMRPGERSQVSVVFLDAQ